MIVKEIKINEKTQKNSAQNLMWRTLNDSLRLSAIISRGFSSESGNKNQKNGWHEIDWKKAEKTIKNLQEKIVIATLDNNFKEVYRQQWILIRSVEAQSVAIRRVITNKGGKTAGTDGVVWTDPQEYLEAVRKLSCIIKDNKNYEAQPLRRVNIPKGNGEVIPLGIPTMMDRAVQALYHLGVDPVVETQSDPNSYGFRKNRSAHDAITAIRNHLDKDNHPRWVLEADIPHRGKISHEFLLKHTPILHKNVLEQWLKAGIMEELNHIETTEGTPQGGIISPTLCNVALNGVEKAIGKANPNKRGISAGVHVIRYADDLIITSKSKEIAFKNKDILSEFLNERGLTLSDKKTRITHVKEGFDFLGFNIRRSKLNLRLNKITEQETVLIIKPREKSIAKLKNSLKRIIIMHKPLEKIVAEANPVLRGWGEYMRISYHSQETFITIDHWVQIKMRKWAYWRKGSLRRTINKYLIRTKNRKWKWGLTAKMKLINLAEIPIVKVTLLKLDRNPYKTGDIEYFDKRREKLIHAKFRAAVYRLHKQNCPICGESLHNGEQVDLHHINPQKSGGKYNMENILPLHQICHQQVTFGNKSLDRLKIAVPNKSKTRTIKTITNQNL